MGSQKQPDEAYVGKRPLYLLAELVIHHMFQNDVLENYSDPNLKCPKMQNHSYYILRTKVKTNRNFIMRFLEEKIHFNQLVSFKEKKLKGKIYILQSLTLYWKNGSPSLLSH